MMKKNLQKDNKTNIFFVITLLLFGYNILLTFLMLQKKGLFFVDFYARWKESAYLCHGINPYMVNETNMIPSIGLIDDNMLTVPWAWLLGMVMNPGWLPYTAAKVVGIIVYALIYFITCCVVFLYWKSEWFSDTRKAEKDFRWPAMAVFLLGSQIYWWWSLACGNQGGAVACILIICICIYKKHPYMCGILMCFAMIKPQLTVIFFLFFLLEKEFKVIFSSFVLGLVSVVTVTFVTGTPVFELINQTFSAGSALENVFFGLFDVFKFGNISVSSILLLDVLFGIVYAFWYWRYYTGCKGQIENDFVLYSGVAIASTFWFYKQPHDNIILTVPCIAFLYLGYVSEEKKQWIQCLSGIVFMVASFYIEGLCRRLLIALKPDILSDLATSIGKSMRTICWIGMGIVLLHKFKHSVKLQKNVLGDEVNE